MLVLDGIHTYYGLSHILFEVSLSISKGEIVCLLGRNGAGKSTTMKSIIGLTPPSRGTIMFKGESIKGQAPYLLARKGIGFVPDDRRVFADLSVDDNLEISKRKDGVWNKNKIYEFFPTLERLKSRRSGYLSGGEQQMLTIARALITNPELLLLDEPSEGIAPMIVKEIEDKILELKETGLGILLAEQNIKSALRVSDRGYIIDNGSIRYQGSIDELKQNDEIRKKYLLI